MGKGAQSPAQSEINVTASPPELLKGQPEAYLSVRASVYTHAHTQHTRTHIHTHDCSHLRVHLSAAAVAQLSLAEVKAAMSRLFKREVLRARVRRVSASIPYRAYRASLSIA